MGKEFLKVTVSACKAEERQNQQGNKPGHWGDLQPAKIREGANTLQVKRVLNCQGGHKIFPQT